MSATIRLMVILTLLAPLSTVHGDEPPVQLNFTVETSSGSLVYGVHLPEATSVRFEWFQRRDYDNANPLLIHWLPVGFPPKTFSAGNTFSGSKAEGFVYAGAGHQTFEAEDPFPGTLVQGNTVTMEIPSKDLFLVITWDRQIGGSRLNFTWPPGTEITLLAQGTGKHHEMEDFQNGARLGVPAAFRAHVLDSLVFDPAPGRQLFGWMDFHRTDLLGVGALNITRGETFSRNISFTNEYDVNERCFCTSRHFWTYTSTEKLTVNLTSIGENQSDLTLFVADLPTAVLPDRYWHEKNTYSAGDERPGNGKE